MPEDQKKQMTFQFEFGNDEIDEDQSNSESEFFPECEATRKKQVSDTLFSNKKREQDKKKNENIYPLDENTLLPTHFRSISIH